MSQEPVRISGFFGEINILDLLAQEGVEFHFSSLIDPGKFFVLKNQSVEAKDIFSL